jgi:LacI family transcriptional regulator
MHYITPPLTTVAFDAAKIGELGAQLVLNEIESSQNGRKSCVLTVKPKLHVRGSTGPATACESLRTNLRESTGEV